MRHHLRFPYDRARTSTTVYIAGDVRYTCGRQPPRMPRTAHALRYDTTDPVNVAGLLACVCADRVGSGSFGSPGVA